MLPIKPHIWFDQDKAKEAAEFYATLMPDSALNYVSHFPMPGGGECEIVEFNVAGQPFLGITVGHGLTSRTCWKNVKKSNMKIESVIPILYSDDVTRSITDDTEVLGFKERWSWDEAPTFGGVVDGNTAIFFCKGNQGHNGTWRALNVDNVDEYYEAIKVKGAESSARPIPNPGSCGKCWSKTPTGTSCTWGITRIVINWYFCPCSNQKTLMR